MAVAYDLKYSDSVSRPGDFIMDAEKIKRLIRRELKAGPGHRVLEIGCNRGDLVKYFQQDVPETYGIDINEAAIRNRVTDNVYLMDSTATTFEDGYFDRIYSSHVIEHIPDDVKLFREIDRLLKRAGIAVLVYPYELIRGMAAIRTSWQAYGTPLKARELHVHLYTPKKITRLIAGTGLVHVKSELFFGRTPQWLTVLGKP